MNASFLRRPTLHLALTLAVCGALLLTWAPRAQAAAPTTLGMSGWLSSGSGPVADGTYKLTFRLYGAAVGGKASWSEGPLDVIVQGGRFAHALGSATPLTSDLLAANAQSWLGVQVGTDPELPLRPLHAVAWALRASAAETLACSGCLGAGHIGSGAISADKIGFTYAGSATKGGPAASAKVASDLQCTGCVSVQELAFDGDVDIGGNALKAKKVQAVDIAANQISATSFVGDGSKLTGLKLPNGACKGAGEVVKGINPDGSLQCVPAMAASALPADGLDEVSNGQLTTEFVHTFSSAKAAPIPDNNPIGVSSDVVVPDVGLVKGLKISVVVKTSDLSQLKLALYDPANAMYALYEGGGKGTALQTSYPAPTKPVSGNLDSWIGKNAKGTWRLKAVDSAFLNNTTDGAIESWSITIDTLSAAKVEAKGLLLTSGGLQLLSAAKEPVTCNGDHFGFMYADPVARTVFVCNGEEFYPISLTTVGTKKSPAKHCKEVLGKAPASQSGMYWVDPDGAGGTAAFQAYCDMDTDGGGWTLVWSNLRGGTKHETNMSWATAIGTPPLFKGTPGEDPEKFQVYTGLSFWNAFAPDKQLRYTWAHDFGKPVDQSYRCTFNLDANNAYSLSFSACKQLVGSVAPGLVTYHGGRKFTTVDKDNDAASNNCAQSYSGAPFWYGACWDGNINGGGANGNGHVNGAYWAGSANAWGSTNGQGGGNGWIFVR